jgi:hypothetical protein
MVENGKIRADGICLPWQGTLSLAEIAAIAYDHTGRLF